MVCTAVDPSTAYIQLNRSKGMPRLSHCCAMMIHRRSVFSASAASQLRSRSLLVFRSKEEEMQVMESASEINISMTPGSWDYSSSSIFSCFIFIDSCSHCHIYLFSFSTRVQSHGSLLSSCHFSTSTDRVCSLYISFDVFSVETWLFEKRRFHLLDDFQSGSHRGRNLRSVDDQ